jgi:glutathione S-transferase
MTTTIHPLELISSPICPYVQRTAITLLEKKIEYKTTFIDLANKPAWFLDISPLGKIPVLRVGPHNLFESLIINEYLDETHPPSLHPKDPITRAKQRAWIEFSSGILLVMHQIITSNTKEEMEEKKLDCCYKLSQIEQILMETPYFNGKSFCFIDIGYAPVFIRIAELEKIYPFNFFENRPKVKEWASALVSRESVKLSLAPDFAEQYRKFVKNKNGFLANKL